LAVADVAAVLTEVGVASAGTCVVDAMMTEFCVGIMKFEFASTEACKKAVVELEQLAFPKVEVVAWSRYAEPDGDTTAMFIELAQARLTAQMSPFGATAPLSASNPIGISVGKFVELPRISDAGFIIKLFEAWVPEKTFPD
jgi:hypothetical protein